MPGGSPQGTLLGQICFIVKFNGALLRPKVPKTLSLHSNSVKAKYMDDSSTAVQIPLDTLLRPDISVRPQPLAYAERTKQILPSSNNMLQMYLEDIEKFAYTNNMKINSSKTKVMKFSRSTSLDFPLEVSV